MTESEPDALPKWTAHETAIVEAGAVIGSGTQIWHHAHVRSDARLGEHCTIAKNVYVDRGVVIGDRVKIQNNVSVYAGVTVDDDAFLGPSAVFTNDLFPRAGSGRWEVVPTLVHRGASVGANATIVCGIELGEWSLVAAGSVVTRSVEDHELVAGNPAARIGWVCRCGRRLTNDGDRPIELRCAQCRAEDRA